MNIDYLLILDKSGSMSSFTERTKGAIKSYFRAAKQSCRDNNVYGYLSVLLFDSGSRQPFEYLYKRTSLEEIVDNTVDEYCPYGSTPIYDAIAKGIIDLQDDLADENGYEDHFTLVNIYSDGAENSSSLFDAFKVKKMIEAMKELRWTFTFQCAGAEDSIRRFAEGISIAKENVQVYTANTQGFNQSYDSLSNAVGIYTTGVACQTKITSLFEKV